MDAGDSHDVATSQPAMIALPYMKAIVHSHGSSVKRRYITRRHVLTASSATSSTDATVVGSGGVNMVSIRTLPTVYKIQQIGSDKSISRTKNMTSS